MKKTILLTITLLITNKITSQTVNNIPINEINTKYIEIIGSCKTLKNEWEISIDYGQKTKWTTERKQKTLLKNKKPMLFNSMIAALNFMHNYGYEFNNAFPIDYKNDKIIEYRYLLKKIKN